MWSLGVVIYECIHGCLPFTAYHMSDLKRKIRLTTPYIREDLDQGLQYFLKGCLAKHPDNRLTIDQILSKFSLTQKFPSFVIKCKNKF